MEDRRGGSVQIEISNEGTVWVNQNGVCMARVQDAREIDIEDRRNTSNSCTVVFNEGSGSNPQLRRISIPDTSTDEAVNKSIAEAGITNVLSIFGPDGKLLPATK